MVWPLYKVSELCDVPYACITCTFSELFWPNRARGTHSLPAGLQRLTTAFAALSSLNDIIWDHVKTLSARNACLLRSWPR
jgi:hypothetical protein